MYSHRRWQKNSFTIRAADRLDTSARYLYMIHIIVKKADTKDWKDVSEHWRFFVVEMQRS